MVNVHNAFKTAPNAANTRVILDLLNLKLHALSLAQQQTTRKPLF